MILYGIGLFTTYFLCNGCGSVVGSAVGSEIGLFVGGNGTLIRTVTLDENSSGKDVPLPLSLGLPPLGAGGTAYLIKESTIDSWIKPLISGTSSFVSSYAVNSQPSIANASFLGASVGHFIGGLFD